MKLSEKSAAAQKIHDYAISYNGFAAKLTAKQAAALEEAEGRRSQ